MTDARLRELERRARSDGSTDEVAAWLLARLRAGALGRDRLQLAAYCGHEPARLALGVPVVSAPEQLEGWVLGLRPWRQAPARAALAAARQVLPLAALETDPEATLEVVSGTAALLDDPDRAGAEAALVAAVARVAGRLRGGWQWDSTDRPWWGGEAWFAQPHAPWAGWVDEVAARAARTALLAPVDRSRSLHESVRAARLARAIIARHPVSGPWTAPVRDVAGEALVAWALA